MQKVLQMMDAMLEKGKQEAAAEAAAYTEYAAWCTTTGTQKEKDIATATQNIERLRAAVLKAKADVARLGDELTQLTADLAKAAGDKKAATELREQEHQDYLTVFNDYSNSVASLEDAERKLAAGPKKVANALVQLDARARSLLDAAQPMGSAFESSSGMIEDMVSGLLSKMRDERVAIEREEAEKLHSYEMLAQELDEMMEQYTDERITKSQKKGHRASDAARHAADEQELVATRQEDRKYASELHAQCEQKAVDMEARRTLRAEELVAVAKAKDIIAGTVSAHAEKHLPQLLQRSLLQLRASAAVQTSHVASLLERAATRTGSRVLAALALRVEDGPFDKVLGMIRGMIEKLQQQASEEADHKQWCDGELQANKNTRDQKTATVNELQALREQLTADIASLSEEMAELSSGVAALDQAVAEATAQRQKEKAKNAEAVQDAEEAQAAVRQALQVLKKFYDKAATATAFAQGPADDAPASFDKPYTGMGGEGGVVGMLEVILSDFVRLAEETAAEETEASHAYDEFTGESSKDKASKTQALEAKRKRKITQQRALQQANRDLKETQTGLDSALDYYAELKPACLDAGVDFAERASRRQDEIESLEQALDVL